MATIQHQVWVNAPVSRVFQAVTTVPGISSWWGPHQSEQTHEGLVLSHDPGPAHGLLKFKLLDPTGTTHAEWEFVSTHPDSSPASAWTGTRVVFDIVSRRNKPAMSGFGRDHDLATVLEFRHIDWDERSEYFGFCNFAWASALLALKKVCETKPS